MLCLLPIGVLAIGGLIGGLCGGIGLAINLSLARRQFNTGLKVVAMMGVVVLSYLAYLIVAGVIHAMTH
jgi:hypothetical protein